MPRIKGPNGLVFTFSDEVAASLLLTEGYEVVSEGRAAEPVAVEPAPAADDSEAAESHAAGLFGRRKKN